MSAFRKKPVVIDAMHWDGTVDGAYDIIMWARSADLSGGIGDGIAFLRIKTLEGNLFASVGDWIIKGVAGEFYPCKPDIFAATYEAVADDEVEGQGRSEPQASEHAT